MNTVLVVTAVVVLFPFVLYLSVLVISLAWHAGKLGSVKRFTQYIDKHNPHSQPPTT